MSDIVKQPRTELIRLPDVKSRTGLSRSEIYRRMNTELSFPQRIKLGKRSVVWVSSEVDTWIAQRINTQRIAA